MFVKVMSSLISGVVGYFRCFNFLCEFYFLYCDDVPLGAVYEFFCASILFLDAVYVDLEYDDDCHLVDCCL